MKEEIKYCSLDFYRESDENGIRWYADVPQHKKEENIMVSGADVFLESFFSYVMAHYKLTPEDRRIYVVCCDDNTYPDYYGDNLFILHRISHNGYGATYSVEAGYEFSAERNNEIIPNKFHLWLCNVVHTVFGDHPKTIYITTMKVHSDESREYPRLRTEIKNY